MSDTVPIPDDDDRLLEECRVETFRSGGAGGQHRDTTESAVRLVHLPTGVRATAQDERSQHRNKQLALSRLRDRLERRNRTKKPRRKTRVSARQKRKRVEEKRRRGRLKRLRKPPRPDRD
jgi:protein subunit release factor A